MVASAFLVVSDHGSRARDKNLATLNKGGKDNRRQRNRGATAAPIFPPTPPELIRLFVSFC